MDEPLIALERRYLDTRQAADHAAWLAERLRQGWVSAARVRFVAELGHHVAAAALGEEVALRPLGGFEEGLVEVERREADAPRVARVSRAEARRRLLQVVAREVARRLPTDDLRLSELRAALRAWAAEPTNLRRWEVQEARRRTRGLSREALAEALADLPREQRAGLLEQLDAWLEVARRQLGETWRDPGGHAPVVPERDDPGAPWSVDPWVGAAHAPHAVLVDLAGALRCTAPGRAHLAARAAAWAVLQHRRQGGADSPLAPLFAAVDRDVARAVDAAVDLVGEAVLRAHVVLDVGPWLLGE